MKSISTKVNFLLTISFIFLFPFTNTTSILAQNVFPAPGFENKQWENINSPQIELIDSWNLVGELGIYRHQVTDGNKILFHSLNPNESAQEITVQQFMLQEFSLNGSLYFEKNGKIVLANGDISENGGITWWNVTSKKNLSLPFGMYNNVLTCLLNNETIYISTGWSGMYKSEDAGDTWTALGTSGLGGDTNGIQNITQIFFNNNTLYAFGDWFNINSTGITNPNYKIGYYSYDLGQTWTPLEANGIEDYFSIYSALVSSYGEIYIAGNGVWKMKNNFWQQLNIGNADEIFLVIKEHQNKLYALSEKNLYESKDGGSTWLKVASYLNVSTSYRLSRSSFVTEYSNPLILKANKVVVYQGSASFPIGPWLYNSDNNTSTKIHFYTTPSFYKPIIYDGIFSLGKLWLATACGLFYSEDNGLTYEVIPITRFYKHQSIEHVGDSLVIATENGIFSSNNNGLSWNEFSVGLLNRDIKCLKKVSNTLYASSTHKSLNDYQRSYIYKYNQLINKWEVCIPKENTIGVNNFDINGNKVIYSTTGSGPVYISNDGGQSFSQIEVLPGFSNKYYGVSIFKNLWLVGFHTNSSNEFRNYYSDDSGLNWKPITLQGNFRFSMDFYDIDNILFGTFGGFGFMSSSRILFSNDGILWYQIPHSANTLVRQLTLQNNYLYSFGFSYNHNQGSIKRIDISGSLISNFENLELSNSSNIVIQNNSVISRIGIRKFIKVTALQFTLEWDPAVATYNGFVASALPGFSHANLGTQDVANGKLYVSWSSPGLTPVTLPDATELINFSFTATGNPGASTAVSFANVELIGLNNAVLPHTTENGSITISEQISISGNITHRNHPLSNVAVQLNQNLQTATQTNGSYSQTVNWNDTYTLLPSKEANVNTYPQNLNAADLAYYQQVLLQQTSTSDALQLKALDVSNNQQVSIQDKTITESVILGLIDAFPNRAAWQFVPANFTSSHAFEYPPAPSFVNPTNHITQNFQAIHLGDVVSNEINTRTKDGYSLQYVLQEEKTDNQSNYYLTIQADVLPNVSALQGSITLPKGMNFSIKDNPKQVQTNVTSNTIKWVWVQEEGQPTTLTKGSTFFTLKLNSETLIEKTKLISELTSGTTLANLAVDGNLQSSVYQYSVTEKLEEENWYMGLPFPNPQHKETESLYVNVKQPQGTTLTMRLTTVQGQQVKESKFTLSGTDERITLTEKPNKGVYLMELSTNTGKKKVSKLVVE